MARSTSTDSSTSGPARVRRTPEQRAAADLGKAQKAVDKAATRVEKAQTELQSAQAEAERAQRYLDYASRNPDLPQGDVAEPELPVPAEAQAE